MPTLTQSYIFANFIKKLVKQAALTFICLLSFSNIFCRQYWQQHINYNITVTLNDTDNTLTGFEKIEYTNNSPDTLIYIWFHIWPNAYKNNSTAFCNQLLVNGSTSFYFSKEADRGYIDQLDFKVNNITAAVEKDAHNIDIIKILLPVPLVPGNSINITTPFHEKLPYNISRGGHVGQTYQVTQWYPKPAVYDSQGWHPMPYLDQGEFYSEYGNFNVSITVPGNYTVAASGDLTTESELKRLKQTGRQAPLEQNNYTQFKTLAAATKKLPALMEDIVPPSSATTKTLHYTLNNAHDFAWFAGKLFLVQYDTLHVDGNVIDVFSYYNPRQATEWKNSIAFIKDAVKFYSARVGVYPYKEVSAVAGANGVNSDGMEYPTITLITTGADEHNLDATIAHEVGHNWFYGVLGTNERDHAWMDEGINNYYQKIYEGQKYGFYNGLHVDGKFMQPRVPRDATGVAISSMEHIKRSQPIDTTAAAYTSLSYLLMVYEKTGLWLQALQAKLGKPAFDKAMQHYYTTWQFKHPNPSDFKQSIEESSSKNIDSLYAALYTITPVNDTIVHRQLKLASFFNFNQTNRYNYISVAPALGLNAYDKIMLGAFIHNYQLPLNKFNFFLAPLYAIGSKTINGAARVSFNNFTPRTWFEASVSASKFSTNNVKTNDGTKLFAGVIKYVPSLNLTVYDKDARSLKKWSFQLRSFILREDKFVNNNTHLPDSIIGKKAVTNVINHFSASLINTRILHPYNANITIDQGTKFLRAGATAHYFVNYGDGAEGLHARFFGGKFFYLQSQTPNVIGDNSRYQLIMAGPAGYEDYTYSDYFVGRNTATGIQSQQMMQRDGFLKIRAGMPGYEIGNSDNWLIAINVNSDIPAQINPFKLLPFKIPLSVFADVGASGKSKTTGLVDNRVLYDAGFQLSFLKSVVNVYFPVVYSNIYRDYLRAAQGKNYFWKTVSFNINLKSITLRKISSSIPL